MRRIDFIGNSNSYPLMILHGMRALGVDAHLHLIHEGPLNAPENLYPQYADQYPDWIHDWRSPDMLSHSPERIAAVRAATRGADALVLNNDAVFLGAEETRPYFCILTGSDLLIYADPQMCRSALDAKIPQPACFPAVAYKCRWIIFLMQQRSAIRSASGYCFFPKGTIARGDALLDNLGAAPELRISFLISDMDNLPGSPQPENALLRIVCTARLTWDKSAPPFHTDLDYKGTDLLLKGFARFLQSGRRAELRLFRKGCHIKETEALLKSLGITDAVQWQAEMTQHDFLRQLEHADIVVDSLSDSHIGMAAADAMSIGRPVLCNSPDHALWDLKEAFPCCHARTEEAVYEWLVKLHDRPSLRKEIGDKSREFASRHFSNHKAASRVLDALRTPRPEPLEALVYEKLMASDCFGAIEKLMKDSETARAFNALLSSKNVDLPRLHDLLGRSSLARTAIRLMLHIEPGARKLYKLLSARSR